MGISTGQPLRGIVTGDFTAATVVVWYVQGDDTPVTLTDLADKRLFLHSIHGVCGTALPMRLFWGVAGDAADNAHALEIGEGDWDKTYSHPQSAPEIPLGYGNNGTFVIGPGAGSSIVIYATAR